jgi:HEAT repeat protein
MHGKLLFILALAGMVAMGGLVAGCSKSDEEKAQDYIKDLQSGDTDRAVAAAEGLGEMGKDAGKEAVQALAKALTSSDAKVREAAKKALEKIDSPEAKKALEDMEGAARELGEGVKNAIEGLKK